MCVCLELLVRDGGVLWVVRRWSDAGKGARRLEGLAIGWTPVLGIFPVYHSMPKGMIDDGA